MFSPLEIKTPSNPPLCYANAPAQMVTNAIDDIIKRMAPTYLELMREAKETPEIISSYKSSLYHQYDDRSLSHEMRMEKMEIQAMAPDCNVIIKNLSKDNKISVFSEENCGFDENQTIDKARLNIRLKVDAKDINDKDPVDQLLSHLMKKICSQGFGKDGTFDIRLEKGFLMLEGRSWKWHYDGESFKTSITVCYSNKKNWSTRIADINLGSKGRPAEHDGLFNALLTEHRASIPSDFKGKLKVDKIRMFIRYNEFYKEGERIALFNELIEEENSSSKKPIPDKKNLAKKSYEYDDQFSLISDYKPKVINFENLLNKEESLFSAQLSKHFIDSLLTKESCDKQYEIKPLSLDLPALNFTKTDISGLLAELKTLNTIEVDTLVTRDNQQVQPQEEKCILM